MNRHCFTTFATRRRLAFAPAVVLVALTAIPAQAQVIEGSIYYYTGTNTISADILGNDVVIGRNPGGVFADAGGDTDILAPYLLTVTSGAKISQNSIATDGYQAMNIFGSHTLDITGGTVGIAWGHGTSTVNVTGGTVADATSSDSSIVNISGGAVQSAYANFSNSRINISGGTVGNLRNIGGTVTISGGAVDYAIGFFDFPTSTLNMTGGTVNNLLSANGTVSVSGGAVGSAQASNLSAFSISGGTVGSAQSYGSAVVTVTGGTVGAFTVSGASTLNLIGSGFSATVGDAHLIFDGVALGLARDYGVTGTLSDGTAFSQTITAGADGAAFAPEQVQLRGLGDGAPNLFVTQDATVGTTNSYVEVGVDEDFNPFPVNVQIVDGANIGALDIYSASNVTMQGGTVYGQAYIDIGSTLRLEGGTLPHIYNNGFFTMTGGALTTLDALDSSVSTILGGSIGEIINTNGAVNISGGIIGPNTLAGVGTASLFTLYGSGFSATNALAGSFQDSFGNGYDGVWWDVRGTLESGQAINTRYFENGGSTGQTSGLVFAAATAPEPGTLALVFPFLVTAVWGAARRRSAV